MTSSLMNKSDETSFSGQTCDGRREHLEYLADLIGELQGMAEREGCRKLARMLAISRAEAQRETLRRE